MTQQRLEPCTWCSAPATCDVVVIPSIARFTTKGQLVTQTERREPACDECRKRLAASHTERVVAEFDRAQQLASVQQCQLF